MIGSKEKWPENLKDAVHELREKTLSNLAAVEIKKKKFKNALKLCNEVNPKFRSFLCNNILARDYKQLLIVLDFVIERVEQQSFVQTKPSALRNEQLG